MMLLISLVSFRSVWLLGEGSPLLAEPFGLGFDDADLRAARSCMIYLCMPLFMAFLCISFVQAVVRLAFFVKEVLSID